MSHIIPLIRSAAVAPILLWMKANGISWQARLRAAGLPESLLDEPERPIPLIAGARFLRDAGRDEGPDIGCRVVSDTSIAELSAFGRVALGARTPRGAIKRLEQAYAHHSSHELFVIKDDPGGLTLCHSFLVSLDAETLHACHQYVAAMVRAVLAGTGHGGPRLARVVLTPHPEAGLGHLRGRLDVEPEPASDHVLLVTMRDDALDRPYVHPGRDCGLDNGAGDELHRIRGEGTLEASLRIILPGMLDQGAPKLEDLAALVPTSPRTFQRRLAAEGHSLAGLIRDIRREQALNRLAHGQDRLSVIAAELGYSDQSSLSRAARRWTGTPPSRLRGVVREPGGTSVSGQGAAAEPPRR
jgi:AraC-like DNA-binding protein